MTKTKKTMGNFKCSECNRQWKSSSAKENTGQECRKCSSIVIPFEIIKKPVNPVSVEQVDGSETFFGYYNCLECNYQWRSSQAKENSGQECRKCLKIVLPFELSEKKSKSPSKKLKGGPFFGCFNCLECDVQWTSSDAYTTHGQECIKCLKAVFPYLVSIEELKGEGPFFGRYSCLECKRDWASSHSWKDTEQKCLKCKKMVLPYQQSKLTSEEDENKESKPNKRHRKDLCLRCIRLGRYCRQFRHKKDGTVEQKLDKKQ